MAASANRFEWLCQLTGGNECNHLMLPGVGWFITPAWLGYAGLWGKALMLSLRHPTYSVGITAFDHTGAVVADIQLMPRRQCTEAPWEP